MPLGHEQPPSATPPPRSTIRTLAAFRRDSEATLPPTPLRDLLAASGASIYVLSTDIAFVDVVAHAAGDQYPISVVQNWLELQAAVESRECGIALLDASLLGHRTVEHVTALAPYAQRLVTLVAVDRAAAPDFVGLLGERRIHRLLMKPSALGATRLFIESAVTRRLELRELHSDGEAAKGSGRGAVTLAQRWTIGVAAGLALLGAGTGVAWWELRERAAPPLTAAVAAAPTDTREAERRQIEDLRAQADLALSEGRLSDTSGTAALELYLAILELAPGDASARNGAAAVVETLFLRAEQSLLAGSLDEAATTLDRIRRVEPASTRLAFLDAQLVRALAAGVSAPAATASAASAEPQTDADARADTTPAEVAVGLLEAARRVVASDPAAASSIAAEARRQGAAPNALASLEAELAASRRSLAQRESAERLDAASVLIRQGALFAPPGNHALAALLRIQNDAPDTEGLAAEWAEFRTAARDAVETAAANGDAAGAEAALAALRDAPETAALADELAAELAARRRQELYLASAVPSSELELVSAPAAIYPVELVEAGIEGWVDVEFVVDRTGTPRDAVVIDARPRNRFDVAALAAVAGYRYAPFEDDGRIYERRVRARVRFVLR